MNNEKLGVIPQMYAGGDAKQAIEFAWPKQSNVVYRIPCSCGQVYIRETKWRLETRLKEHQDACERGMMEKSAVAEHAWEHHHPIHWEETTVLDHGRGQELLVKEALHIQMTPVEECFN